MGFFDDMTDAVITYPRDYLTIEIIDVDIPGQTLNAGDEATFRIQVTNSGPLLVTDLNCKVKGMNGALVRNSGAAAVFADSFVTTTFDQIDGHRPNDPVELPGGRLSFRAPSRAQARDTLVRVTLNDWNVDLTHPLLGHSDPDTSEHATYVDEVVAT